MKKRFFACLFLLPALAGSAQEPAAGRIAHEVTIDSVRVIGRRPGRADGVSAGARVSTIGTQVLSGNQTRSLSDLISNNSTIYIKSKGQGAAATSSFRGTAARHTQVNWNGIAVNPSMSGSFDFSQVPVFFVDNVTLYHGGSYLKNGTGALGGSVNIANTGDWSDSTRLRVMAEAGSYGTYTGGASARFVREKALYQTRLYYQQSENNYKYLNRVLTNVPFYERRKEAQYKQAGVMQEAYFRPGRWSTVSTNLWMQYGDRNLPQQVTSTHTNRHEKQEDFGLKYLLQYGYERDRHAVSVKGAYVYDRFEYNRRFGEVVDEEGRNLNNAHAFHLSGDYTYRPSERLELAADLRYVYDLVSGTHLAAGRVDRHQVSLQGGARWQAADGLTLDGRVMGEVNGGDFAPTFSAGVSARIAEKFSVRANANRNYKYPALNDLYWDPGGNPGLRPEHGYSYDLTLLWTPRIGQSLYLRAEATGYLMDIDDWIMWLRDGQTWFFVPYNVATVLSYGLELLTEATLQLPAWELKLGVNYAYSPSLNRDRSYEESSTYNRQLPYIPRHKGNARFGLKHRGFFFSWLTSYTGKRYTTPDEWLSTNAYWLHDAEVGYEFLIGRRYRLTPRLRVDNLFNAYYESTQYYPMPRRLIAGGVTFTF